MKVLIVTHNGKRVYRIGLKKGLLSADIMWMFGDPRPPMLWMRLAGLDSQTDEHVEWKPPRLRLGDTITIQLLEGDRCDAEKKRYPTSKNGHASVKQKRRRKSKSPKR